MWYQRKHMVAQTRASLWAAFPKLYRGYRLLIKIASSSKPHQPKSVRHLVLCNFHKVTVGSCVLPHYFVEKYKDMWFDG